MRRARSYFIAVFVFIVVIWFIAKQLDTQSAHERHRLELSSRVEELEKELRALNQHQVKAQIQESPVQHDTSLSDLKTRSTFLSPTFRTAQGSCEDSKPLRSSAELQTVELLGNISFSNKDGGVWKQGWEIKYDESSFSGDKKLQVIVMPHSHNDPGWIKTFEKYFSDQTKKILDNVVKSLTEKPDRKFIWAEISFLSMWWDQADEQTRLQMQRLVRWGQLELVTAGWVMEDEANTHVFAMVDQMIEGNHWVKDNLGVIPKSAWAIDPFGHSPTVAYLRSQMGFEDMLIQRTHYEVKKHLASKELLEFQWRQTWDQRGSHDMFCHMMPFYSYDVPHTCGPDPKICCQFDFARLPSTKKYSCPWKVPPAEITDVNVEEKAKTILDQYKKKSTLFKSNVVLIPLGDDFRYDNGQECDRQFSNYEKLFQYINSHPELNAHVQWGTLSDYFALLHRNTRPSQFPTLSGDFYTYADRDQHYWSGYFTSRPFYKKLDRVLESRIRSAEVIFSLANFVVPTDNAARSLWHQMAPDLLKKLTVARRNLALFQHHDGITGTAKDHVVVDYGTKLLKAIHKSDEVISNSASYLLLSSDQDYFSQHKLTSLDMLSLDHSRPSHDALPVQNVIPVTSFAVGHRYPLLFYNSLAFQRQQIVSVLVDSPHVKVVCHAGSTIPSQISARWSTYMDSLSMEPDVYELWFQINIHPLSLSRYFVVPVESPSSVQDVAVMSSTFVMRTARPVDAKFAHHALQIKQVDPENFKLENYQLVVECGDNGLIKKVSDRNSNKELKVDLSFVTYGTASGKDKSGAYLFLPDGAAKPIPSLSPPVAVEKGPVFSRVTVALPNVIHTVRLFNSPGIDGQLLSISNLVDIKLLSNREMAMRIDAPQLLQTPTGPLRRTFYTDLNGFQMQARHFYSKLPAQANFYPMPTQLVVDGPSVKSRMSLHSGQSLGVGMTEKGEIDVILDRRLAQDDNRGLFQGVMDNKVTPNDFWLLFENFEALSRDASDYTIHPTVLSQQASVALNNPILTLQPSAQPSEGFGSLEMAALGFKSQLEYLPCDVHLLNWRTMKLSPPEALLILHRQGHSCRKSTLTDSTVTNCSLSNGAVHLSAVFNAKHSLKFQHFSLNGITALSETFTESANIGMFEMSTFQVTQ